MLAIAIHLHGDVIAMLGGEAVTGLHRAADAQVERQADDRGPPRHEARGGVRRTVVDNHHVELRHGPLHVFDDTRDRPGFVIGRDNHNATNELQRSCGHIVLSSQQPSASSQ